MYRKMAYTWRVMGASWKVLKKDKELLLFLRPVIELNHDPLVFSVLGGLQDF